MPLARRARPPRRIAAATACTLIAVVAVACTSDDDPTGATDATTTTSTTTAVPLNGGDGVLSIGVLLPATGAGAQLGGPMINAVRLAVDLINDSGGVLGERVLMREVDEGGSVSSAAIGLASLLETDVDAIIGPASSLAALAELDTVVSAGILTCSPTATALALDGFPDNGLFFRTAPSDSLQAVAIAQSALLTGATTVAVGYLDDAYGRGLADAVTAALDVRGLAVTARSGFARAEIDLTARAEELLADEPGVVVVLGDADAGTRLLSAIGDVGLPATTRRILVNDAIRLARSSQLLVDLPDRVRGQIVGIAPSALAVDRDDLAGPFAPHAYDCANLIALATERAGTDAPARVATQIAAVSDGGSVCRTFEVCAERLRDGLQIEYNGPSGSSGLSVRTGDPTRARFEQFVFDDGGRDVSGTTFDVTVD